MTVFGDILGWTAGCHPVSLEWGHRAKVLQNSLTESHWSFRLDPRESVATHSVVQIDDGGSSDGGSSDSGGGGGGCTLTCCC